MELKEKNWSEACTGVWQLYGYMESEPLTLQLFIGTADDRLLRPHAFYQVHRITGKTVSTASHEVMQSNTKILEIPLLPENNMRAIIDCAGILKLRNSDIELRKGETDIGRKNTRVRLVFRVHINQTNGRTVSLQTASNPIECSQRSAQELPLVEKQSVESYPATGGKMMLLSDLNFLPDSKVVFVEKAQVSPPVKIEQALPESHMWCALSHYIFNQSIFTFAEVSIACSLVLATS
ncbi:nuclear factor of activated T-cells, cytoplasmic 1 isoform X1 [Lates japonicus]|uniref:Nuclear factor of activated T-cells, cytoplasmic 1 isoform X1 n=1 Tax=Lates japonicus TaxID=270547 RepID=A0AAD3RIE9_LATJO|nr:nuclear factor of activated T-cells, cytoplasmic 1 isoform X1 [Lates japonicus]